MTSANHLGSSATISEGLPIESRDELRRDRTNGNPLQCAILIASLAGQRQPRRLCTRGTPVGLARRGRTRIGRRARYRRLSELRLVLVSRKFADASLIQHRIVFWLAGPRIRTVRTAVLGIGARPRRRTRACTEHAWSTRGPPLAMPSWRIHCSNKPWRSDVHRRFRLDRCDRSEIPEATQADLPAGPPGCAPRTERSHRINGRVNICRTVSRVANWCV